MTPPTDNPRVRQRLAHVVLGDLLETDLPVIDWNVQKWSFEDDVDLIGWIRPIRPSYGDAEIARDMVTLARFLRGEIEKTSFGWRFEVEIQGVRICAYAELLAEYVAAHEPPPLEELLNRDLAGQFVRRSDGQVAEAVRS